METRRGVGFSPQDRHLNNSNAWVLSFEYYKHMTIQVSL